MMLAPLALVLAVPAAAQDDGQRQGEARAAAEAFAESMRAAFAAEPLSAAEEARLPLASELVWQVLPEGSYAAMMAGTFDKILQPILGMMPDAMPPSLIAARLGVAVEEVEALPAEQQARIGALLDPAYKQRGDAAMKFMMGRMRAMMAEVEPAMRSGLSRAYARRFDDAQLADIQAFFATPTGALYARESMQVFTDPQVMQASMELMPRMMQAMPDMIGGMQQAGAHLPPERGYADLDAGQRTWLAKALGIGADELRRSMEAAEAASTGADW